MPKTCKYWSFLVYPESAPGDWEKRLEATLVPCAISPLHAPDDEHTKEHYHVMLGFQRKVGISSARDVCNLCGGANGYVEECYAPLGAFEYLTHKNSPEKQQFGDDVFPRLYNGFKRPRIVLDDEDMFEECITLVLEHNILEFIDLVKYFRECGMSEKSNWVLKHSYALKTMCDSQRYSSLQRKADIQKRLDELDKEPTKMTEHDRKKGWQFDYDNKAPFECPSDKLS